MEALSVRLKSAEAPPLISTSLLCRLAGLTNCWAESDLIQGRCETILLTDDDESVRETLRTLLDMFGYRVLSASNGSEGLFVYQKNHDEIDLVIMDMIMPVMDGRECLSKIIKFDPYAKIITASGCPSMET